MLILHGIIFSYWFILNSLKLFGDQLMKLIIDTSLWKKMKAFEDDPNSVPKIFADINKNNDRNVPAYTNSPVEFFNHMQSRIANDLNISEPFSNLSSIDDIQSSRSTGGENIALLVKDDGTRFSDVIIAYSDKAGNTLLVQQMSSYLISTVQSDKSIKSLYVADGYSKLIYFTYDLNQKKYAPSIQTAVRSSAVLGFKLIEMFPSVGHDFSPFQTAKEAYDYYFSNRRESDLRIDLEGGRIVIKRDSNKDMGSVFYGPVLQVLAYYKLSHPELGFDEIEFKIASPEGGYVDTSKINQLKFVDDIFKGHFVDGTAFQNFDINQYQGSATNQLIYGAPGTGKSYKVKTDIESNHDGVIERITFFNDFDYTDFVGGLKPQRDQFGNVQYNFVPGAFTRVLVEALNDRGHKHLLIIEELNRANASAVFGEVFQLLDRDENGISTYSIFNGELADYLDGAVQGFTNFRKTGIRLPGNMSIVATMNPADQGVQQIDTAFKRRWIAEYMPIDFDTISYGNSPTADARFTWKQVGEAINEYLLNEIKVEEDALIGQYFLKEKEITDPKIFADKLLGYLWTDAARYSDGLFIQNTFADVQKIFTTNHLLSEVLTLDAFKSNVVSGSSPIGDQDGRI